MLGVGWFNRKEEPAATEFSTFGTGCRVVFFLKKNWFEDTADHLSMSSILHAPFHHMLTIFIDIIPTLLLRKL